MCDFGNLLSGRVGDDLFTCLWVFSLSKPASVCLWLAGVTSGHGGTVVFFPVGLNKQFCAQLNNRNGLGLLLRALFLVLLGAGPDCITGPVTRTDCDIYHGGHSHT